MEVDSSYHTECSMKAIRNGYGLRFASYLVHSVIVLFSHRGIYYLDMRTVAGILAFRRHTTCIASNFRGGTIRRYRTTYYLSWFLRVAFLRTRYLTCAIFPLALWRSHDTLLLVSSLLCVAFLRAWYAQVRSLMLFFHREIIVLICGRSSAFWLSGDILLV